jgi:hypothetical protein
MGRKYPWYVLMCTFGGMGGSQCQCYVLIDGQCVLVSGTHLGPMTKLLLLPDSYGFVDVGRLIWSEDGSVVSTAAPFQHSHSQVRVQQDSWPYFTVSTLVLLPTWRARSLYLYSLGTGWPSYTPRNWICSLLASSSSYIVTDSQSASLSWCRAPFGAGDQMLHFFEWQFFYFSCRACPLTRGRRGL